MTKPLSALVLLVLALPLACSAAEEPPDPLARPAGFCEQWAAAACQQTVIDACDTTQDSCMNSQSTFCLDLLPSNYDSKQAKACLTAVKAAYKDANLTAEELQVVRYLAEPCDQLSRGTSEEGESCGGKDDCNTAAGFACIFKLGAADGLCQKPEEVPPGDACDGDAQVCEDGYFCNGENCVAYKKTGGTCDGDYECNPEDRCLQEVLAEAGTCTARAALNDPCSTDDDCQSGYCVRESTATEGECASMIRLSRSEPLCDDLQ